MAYYIKKFNNESEYNAYMSDNPLLPNVSLVGTGSGNIHVNPIKVEAGTIVYYDGTLKYCSPSDWVSILGTPVAVVVVPSTHTPDGTVRAMAVTGVNRYGTSATTDVSMEWGPQSTDTGLPNLKKVPTWNNTIGGTVGNAVSAYASSNKGLTGATDCLDSTLKYFDTKGPFIPNPYLPDGSPNPDYRNTVEATAANACADFDGPGNTTVLVSLGSAYSAANACHLYSADGISAGNWYLPAAGELGYIMPRYNQIQSSLNIVGGVQLGIGGNYGYWSSSEDSSYNARNMYPYNGKFTDGYGKSDLCYVRPFCSLRF